eukprot:gnl/MRDRNA2_/MRDRNA2_34476_c0_seq1.p1 gnl/MRDRNA2_/MRDRNA2_34476_c0~~gnl/MRDRNA2_/MRDRNA2_34476_c0_seq1.p1  ORF type:complete len:454 (+),score=59.24 gnl/MRDRNA2_/MRDRNA2_34476_c0_seq1:119-1480(+)
MTSTSDLLQCPVCLDAFEDPQVLAGCGHSFCLRCVRGLNGRCPVCRGRFAANGVRPNFALRQVMEGGRSESIDLNTSMQVEASTRPDPIPSRSSLPSADRYREFGVPPCLAKLLAQEDEDIGVRIFLLDNSGSMTHPDGHILLQQGQSFRSVPATRWDEVREMAIEQARWNVAAGTPCEFVLLNSATPNQPQEQRDFFRVFSATDVEGLQRFLDRNPPRGSTPLAERIDGLRQRLAGSYSSSSADGRKIMLTIATDGVPNGNRGTFVQALRRITSELPVNIVIRLATDEDDIVEYYNRIDEEVELPLDILDDLKGEAKEIYALNPWLTYSPLIHRVREGGTLNKLFDLLDERCLTPMEVGLFSQLLLRNNQLSQFPRDPEGVIEAVTQELPSAPLVWDARRSCMAPPINLSKLHKAMYPKKYTVTSVAQWLLIVLIAVVALVYKIHMSENIMD